MYSVGMLDKGMASLYEGGLRFHDTTQNGAQFKTYGFFISGIFHLIFSDHS